MKGVVEAFVFRNAEIFFSSDLPHADSPNFVAHEKKRKEAFSEREVLGVQRQRHAHDDVTAFDEPGCEGNQKNRQRRRPKGNGGKFAAPGVVEK